MMRLKWSGPSGLINALWMVCFLWGHMSHGLLSGYVVVQ